MLSQLLADSSWHSQRDALQLYCADAECYQVAQIMPALVKGVSDLRSMVVNVACEAAVIGGETMDDGQAWDVWRACAGGAAVTKKVMKEARVKGALAVVKGREEMFWERMLEWRTNEQIAVRMLVVDSINVLINEQVDEEKRTEWAVNVVRTVLSCVCDRSDEVRKGCKQLIQAWESKVGTKDLLLEGVSEEVKKRLEGDQKKKGVGKGKMSLKEMMKARRAALRVQKENGEKGGVVQVTAVADQENVENA